MRNYPFERFGTTMTNTSITAGSMAATRTHTTIQPLQPPPIMQLLLPQQTIQILHLFKDLHPAVVVAMPATTASSNSGSRELMDQQKYNVNSYDIRSSTTTGSVIYNQKDIAPTFGLYQISTLGNLLFKQKACSFLEHLFDLQSASNILFLKSKVSRQTSNTRNFRDKEEGEISTIILL